MMKLFKTDHFLKSEPYEYSDDVEQKNHCVM